MYCSNETASWLYSLNSVLKGMEWLFYVMLAFFILNIVFSRFFYERSIGLVNWLIKSQGLEGIVSGTDRAFKAFKRDMWLLAALMIVAIYLLNLT